MAQYHLTLFLIAIGNIINAKFFEFELPNRTVTICPTNSLISIECPQKSDSDQWPVSNLPLYLISIDYIRSFPTRLGQDSNSCQPDLSHACSNYDLRYINTLCNGKPQCQDLPTYQIRDRSLCAFKAITEIVYHCVPTWNLRDIQTKCDICKNGSLTNDYGFIYSRNYPLQTLRIPCFTTIYARPYHKTVLYIVNAQLNFDQLRIESVSSEGITILNISLNGNQTTQQVAVSTYEMKITFLPGNIYSSHPTSYLLYFYTIPICSFTDPCQPILPTITTTTTEPPPTTTTRKRIQSAGWTSVQNIWIIIPIILAYVLLLLLIIVLALLFQRRRKQQKALQPIVSQDFSARYLDSSGASSRTQLVTPPTTNGPIINTYRRTNSSQNFSNSQFAHNMERYHRESQSEYDLHHGSIPYRTRASSTNINYRPYGTMDNTSSNFNHHHRRRSLPKSFSDCDLCKREIYKEEYQEYSNEDDDNWRLENSLQRRIEPRSYREKIKERFRERLTVRNIPDGDVPAAAAAAPISTVEYSSVAPRHQRLASESNRTIQHLPFEYIPNENNNIRTVEYKRNSNQERMSVGNCQQRGMNDESCTTNFTVKFYDHDNEDTLDRCLHEAREVQEMSMRMSEQQHFNRQQRRFTGNTDLQ